MRTIIVTTDFSAEAENATLYAAAAASRMGLKIILFTLQRVSIHALNSRVSARSYDQIIRQFHEMIAEAATKLSEVHKIEVVPYLATGDFYDELESCNFQYNADMVVMGMASKSLEQDLLGNTTTNAIERLSIPVLAVPLAASFTGMGKIMFACDVLRGVQTKVLQQVRDLAKVLGATVEIFHVRDHVMAVQENHLEQENIGLIQSQLSGIQYYYRGVESKRIVEAIKYELEKTNSDLLIMVTHRYGFWNSLVHRSKTRVMAAGANIPLLSLPI